MRGVPTVGPTAPSKQATFKVKTTLRFLYLLSFLTLRLHGTQPPWDSALLVQRSGYQSLRVLHHLCPLSSFKTTLMLILIFNSANLNSTTLAGQRLTTLKEWSPALISGHLSSLMRQQGFPSTQVKFQRGLTDERQERGRMSANTTLSLF